MNPLTEFDRRTFVKPPYRNIRSRCAISGMNPLSAHARVFLEIGPAVDRYLTEEGALAQAAGPDTIRISSRILHLPKAARQLVLAHECAHLEQLARPGDDPQRALEDEAWEAAAAWIQGRPYRIQGRGRGRLNAAAILDASAHPHAQAWYRLGQEEPIGNKSSIRVDTVHPIKGITFEAILDKMLELKGTTEFVIVSHGTKDGLMMPLLSGSKSGTDTATVGALAKDVERESQGPAGTARLPAISDENVAVLALLKDAQHVVRMRVKMNRIRALGPKHIAFRACNMGADNGDALKIFNQFFQAASVSAPKEDDSYGTFEPGTPLAMPELKKWANQKRLERYMVSITDNVAIGTRQEQGTIRYFIVCKPATKDAMAPWVKKHIFDGYKSGALVYHAIFRPTWDPQVNFVRDQEFKDAIVFVPR